MRRFSVLANCVAMTTTTITTGAAHNNDPHPHRAVILFFAASGAIAGWCQKGPPENNAFGKKSLKTSMLLLLVRSLRFSASSVLRGYETAASIILKSLPHSVLGGYSVWLWKELPLFFGYSLYRHCYSLRGHDKSVNEQCECVCGFEQMNFSPSLLFFNKI